MKAEAYMKLAQVVAEESTCPRAKVGAVVVRDARVISLGYNGAPSGLAHCTQVGCLEYPKGTGRLSCYRAVHAELNALLNASRFGVSLRNCDLYCTHSPCVECLKAMINLGVVMVMYRHHYQDELAQKLYREIRLKGGITLVSM